MRRLLMLAGACGATLAWAPASAQAPVKPIYREIGDWILACDNIRSCVAKAAQEDVDYDGQGFLKITRTGGPTGEVSVTLEARDRLESSRLRLDGKAITPLAWRRVTAAEHELAGPAAIDFIAATRNGEALDYPADGKTRALSLKGLTAVLLAMDEAQGRVGHPSALIRKTPSSSQPVPPAPPVPVLTAAAPPPPLSNPKALAAAVRKARKADLERFECDEGLRQAEDEAQPLTATEAIVTLTCYFGAYQGNVIAFRVPIAAPDKARVLTLPKPLGVNDPDNLEGIGQYGDGAYDPRTAEFFQSSKGRGLGDCGLSVVWTFDGKDFHLAQVNYQERCSGGPGDWPVLYRTRRSG